MYLSFRLSNKIIYRSTWASPHPFNRIIQSLILGNKSEDEEIKNTFSWPHTCNHILTLSHGHPHTLVASIYIRIQYTVYWHQRVNLMRRGTPSSVVAVPRDTIVIIETQIDNNTKGTQWKLFEIVHQCRATRMKIRIIELAYLSISLIEVAPSTEEPYRLEANWDTVRTDNIRCYWNQVRGTKLCKIVDLLPHPEGSDDRFVLRVVSLKQHLES